LKFTGCSKINLSQTMKADATSKCMLLWECRGIVDLGNFIRVEIEFLNNAMKTLHSRVYAYPSVEINEWKEYALIANAPDDTSWVKVSLRISGQQDSGNFEFLNPRLYHQR